MLTNHPLENTHALVETGPNLPEVWIYSFKTSSCRLRQEWWFCRALHRQQHQWVDASEADGLAWNILRPKHSWNPCHEPGDDVLNTRWQPNTTQRSYERVLSQGYGPPKKPKQKVEVWEVEPLPLPWKRSCTQSQYVWSGLGDDALAEGQEPWERLL